MVQNAGKDGAKACIQQEEDRQDAHNCTDAAPAGDQNHQNNDRGDDVVKLCQNAAIRRNRVDSKYQIDVAGKCDDRAYEVIRDALDQCAVFFLSDRNIEKDQRQNKAEMDRAGLCGRHRPPRTGKIKVEERHCHSQNRNKASYKALIFHHNRFRIVFFQILIDIDHLDVVKRLNRGILFFHTLRLNFLFFAH